MFTTQLLELYPRSIIYPRLLGPLRPWPIVAHDVSWARKREGHKMNVVFPCCENWETFAADTKCF